MQEDKLLQHCHTIKTQARVMLIVILVLLGMVAYLSLNHGITGANVTNADQKGIVQSVNYLEGHPKDNLPANKVHSDN